MRKSSKATIKRRKPRLTPTERLRRIAKITGRTWKRTNGGSYRGMAIWLDREQIAKIDRLATGRGK